MTPAGNSYVGEIRSALEQMQTATINLLANRGVGGILTLATPPAFCVKWLIPRLDRFSAAHPQVLVSLATRSKPFDFEAEKIDAAIYFGRRDWPGVMSDRLVGEDLVVVCSPGYRSSQPRLEAARGCRGPYAAATDTPAELVERLADGQERQHRQRLGRPRFEHFYMIMQAAVAGLGVALLPRLLVKEDVSARRLVIPFEAPFQGEDAYCLVYPPAKRSDSRLEPLRRWLLEEAAADRAA